MRYSLTLGNSSTLSYSLQKGLLIHVCFESNVGMKKVVQNVSTISNFRTRSVQLKPELNREKQRTISLRSRHAQPIFRYELCSCFICDEI